MEIKTLNGQRRWSVCNFDRFKFESFDSVERQNVAWQITAYFHSISSVFIFLPKCLSFLFSLRLLLPLPGQRNRWRRRRRREKKGWKTPSKPTQMAAILLLLTDIKFVEKSAFFPSTFRIRKKNECWVDTWKKNFGGLFEIEMKWNARWAIEADAAGRKVELQRKVGEKRRAVNLLGWAKAAFRYFRQSTMRVFEFVLLNPVWSHDLLLENPWSPHMVVQSNSLV